VVDAKTDTSPGVEWSGGKEVTVFGADLPLDQIREKLRSSDAKEMADAVVQMVTMQQRREVSNLLQGAWDHAVGKYPDLNWQVVGSRSVRLALAQVLGQWHPDDPQYRGHILSEIERAEGMEKADTLIALGAVATESDIGFLEHVGREADDIAAAGALAALQIAGGESATEALERVKNDLTLSVQRRKLAAQLLGLPRPPRGESEK
jgi:hypothetical protein